MNLIVITVVLNDLDGYLKTREYIAPLVARGCQWIVVDGMSSDGTEAQILADSQLITIAISRSPKGVYNAMNAALELVCIDYHIFINAGDGLELHKSITGRMRNTRGEGIF